MDKKKLNNEIVLCRGAVRKARVAVIRKILKNMKILKTCKNEALKEKKLRKADRLLEKVQIMKRLKDDDVTKFALRNKDLESFLKESSTNLKQNALACLAKHEAISKRIRTIRDQIPDWEFNLPLLLDSLGKKKLNKKTDKLVENKQVNVIKTKRDEIPKVRKKVTNLKEKDIVKSVKKQLRSEKAKHFEESDEDEEEKDRISEEVFEPPMKVEKVDDPFFIEKKIIAPKLQPETLNEKLPYNREKRGNSSISYIKPFKAKRDSSKFNVKVQSNPVQEEEKLHPSWAAKKVQLIKPFEGKKIKFSDD